MPDYSDVYPRIGRLLGSSGEDLQDSDLDSAIGLTIRANLPPQVLQGQTWQAFYGAMSGDDLDAFDQAIALLVAADLKAGLDAGSGLVLSTKLGDQVTTYDSRSLSDARTLAADWRRLAARLLSLTSFYVLIPKRTVSGFGVNGPTRTRLSQWGCGE